MDILDAYENALATGDTDALRAAEDRIEDTPELVTLDRYRRMRGTVDEATGGMRTFNGMMARGAGDVMSLAAGGLPTAAAIVGTGGAVGTLAEDGTAADAALAGARDATITYAGGKALEAVGRGVAGLYGRAMRSLDDSLTWGWNTVDGVVGRTPYGTPRAPELRVRPEALVRRAERPAMTGETPYVIDEAPALMTDAEMERMAAYYGAKPGKAPEFVPPWAREAGGKLNERTWKWYDDLANRYGEKRAEQMLETISDSNFQRYFYGRNPEATLADIDKYREMRRIVNAVTEPNEIVLGGSAGISSEGTIYRDSAVPHDLDFSGYIADASRRTDYGSEEATRVMVEALSDKARVENSPIIRKLREMYPEARDATFHWPSVDWEISGGYQYTPGVFTVLKVNPDTMPGGHVSRTISTMIGGNKVDIMLQDGALGVSRTNPRLGNTEVAFDAKRMMMQGKKPTSKRFIKDSTDINGYRDYSEDNPVIDLGSHRAQYDPFMFADDLVDEGGMPRVFDMETFPGSGERVPVVMNTEGVILQLERPRLLETYAPMHPQNMARYAGAPATAETHPLVAIRGADRRIREGAAIGGEYAPNIGIYRADKPEEFVESVFQDGARNWFTDGKGGFKDIVVYPRSAVDPKASVRNRLWDRDAWADMPSRSTMRNNPLSDWRKSVDEVVQHPYSWSSVTPFYTEIGNAYRNRIYGQNPTGKALHLLENDYAGYGEAMPTGFVKDGIVLRGADYAKDPEGFKKRFLDAIMSNRFAAPLGVGAVGAVATQQAAKGGDASDGKRESTAATREQLTEAAAFLRLVVERGFAKTDDEIEKCERLAKAIEDSIQSASPEPSAPLEPLEQAPADPGTAGAIGGGETDDEKRVAELSAGGESQSVQEDTSTEAEREQFLEERGMDTSLAETGSMEQLQNMHDEANRGEAPSEEPAQTPAGGPAEPQTAQAPVGEPTEAQTGSGQTASERIGVTSDMTGAGGRKLTAGEAAWQERRNATTAAWRARTGRDGFVVSPGSVGATDAGEELTPGSPEETASGRIGVTSDMTGVGGRKLTAGEATWQRKRNRLT